MGFDMILNAGAAIRKVDFEKTAFSDGIRFDGQGSPIGHGIDGVEGQI